jgi:hypothetical protein
MYLLTAAIFAVLQFCAPSEAHLTIPDIGDQRKGDMLMVAMHCRKRWLREAATAFTYLR